jgi:hypothetical protein
MCDYTSLVMWSDINTKKINLMSHLIDLLRHHISLTDVL